MDGSNGWLFDWAGMDNGYVTDTDTVMCLCVNRLS